MSICPLKLRDLDWWDYLLNDWNGKSFFLMGSWTPLPNFEISSDAASGIGCGAIFENSWFALRWPELPELPDITILELVPIVLAACFWGTFWSQQTILFQYDNMAVVQVLQNSTAKDSHLLKLLRYLTYFAVKFNVNFSAIRTDGKFNPGPDCLSHFRLQAFKQLYPYAEEEPTN